MSTTLTPTRDALLEIARSLPAAPQILAGISELLQDVNTDLDQLAREIEMDAALTGRVIRVSNSVVYGGRGTVGSVEEAIGRVGFSEVVRLVGTATIAGLVDRDLPNYHLSVDVLREALLLHALAAEALGEAAGVDRHRAYVTGLLRGIGIMILDRYARDRLQPELRYDPTEYPTYRDWERVRFGLEATGVTTMALDDWKLPEEVVGALACHLDPPDDDDDVSRLANILNLAGAIATDHGGALPGEIMHWIRTPEKLERAGLDENQFAGAAERAGALFEQQRNALY
ncbi:MAG TPA: HDOD domain-containing protein [Opitutaceae bacterium]|nr:HDOD domain-containing protein [Opitutaceae bacterium]